MSIITADMIGNLVNADWAEAFQYIDDGSIDLIYMDPPYEMNYKSQIPGHKQWNKTGKAKKEVGRLLNDQKGGVDWKVLAKECYRVLKDDSFLFLHCNLDLIWSELCRFGKFTQADGSYKDGFNIKGEIVWNKRFAIGGDLTTTMKRDWEPIIYMTKGKPSLNPLTVKRKKGKQEIEKTCKRISEIMDWVFKLPEKEKLGFPTQKPVALCKQVIELASRPDDIVLDPFAGSCTGLLAAKELGRKFIGIEMDAKVCEDFKSRIGVTKVMTLPKKT